MQHRLPAIFVADSLGLDFLNSIATPVDTPVDWLDSGDGLLRWLAQAKLGPLNRLLERDEAFSQISRHHHGDGGRLELRMMRRWRSSESLLLPIGEALAEFVCEENLANVKACEGHTCTLVFADRTRRRGRRWCSMAICGNRAKQAAHRSRLKNKN